VPKKARIAIKLQRDKDALALDCTLVTNNDAEFLRVPGLRVENWLAAEKPLLLPNKT